MIELENLLNMICTEADHAAWEAEIRRRYPVAEPRGESRVYDILWIEDLARCSSHSPCGECDRCTKGGRPWREVRRDWLKAPFTTGAKVTAKPAKG